MKMKLPKIPPRDAYFCKNPWGGSDDIWTFNAWDSFINLEGDTSDWDGYVECRELIADHCRCKWIDRAERKGQNREECLKIAAEWKAWGKRRA